MHKPALQAPAGYFFYRAREVNTRRGEGASPDFVLGEGMATHEPHFATDFAPVCFRPSPFCSVVVATLLCIQILTLLRESKVRGCLEEFWRGLWCLGVLSRPLVLKNLWQFEFL